MKRYISRIIMGTKTTPWPHPKRCPLYRKPLPKLRIYFATSLNTVNKTQQKRHFKQNSAKPSELPNPRVTSVRSRSLFQSLVSKCFVWWAAFSWRGSRGDIYYLIRREQNYRVNRLITYNSTKWRNCLQDWIIKCRGQDVLKILKYSPVPQT